MLQTTDHRPLVGTLFQQNWQKFALFLPILFASLLVVLTGPDTNEDLYWYHHYIAWSWLNDRMFLDLAPAGFPTWYNPFMDTFFYEMYQHIHPSIIVGIIIGLLQGFIFIPLYLVIRRIFPDLSYPSSYFLALSGIITPAWISEIGTTIGDAATVPITALSVYASIRAISSGDHVRKVMLFALAGGLAGLAMGLKLTNAVNVVALGIAVLVSMPWKNSRAYFIWLSVGAILGFMLTGGYWVWKIWTLFGNPLFPQFSNWFQNPLTQNVSIAAPQYLPKNTLEKIFWPIIFSLNPDRVQAYYPPITPLLWLLFIPTIVIILFFRTVKKTFNVTISAEWKFLWGYVITGLIAWENIFSVYRYLAQIEVFLPCFLVSFVATLRSQNSAYRLFRPILRLSIFFAVIILLLRGGAAKWTENLFSLPPTILSVHHSAIVLGEFGTSYLAAEMPSDNIYLQLNPGFQFSSLYDRSFEQRLKTVPTAYLLAVARHDWRADNVVKVNSALASLGVLDSAKDCSYINYIFTKAHTHASFEWVGNPHQTCRLVETRADYQESLISNQIMAFIVPLNRELSDKYSYHVDVLGCTLQKVFNGSRENDYFLCPLKQGKLLE